MTEKLDLDFTLISQAIKKIPLPPIDHVVGIATGGIVPAALLAFQIGCDYSLIRISFRGADNQPQRAAPALLSSGSVPVSARRILLVDDVSVSGKTLALGRDLLKDYEVVTLVLKGSGDYVLFPDIAECVNWPWGRY